jgi:hypothetical protein
LFSAVICFCVARIVFISCSAASAAALAFAAAVSAAADAAQYEASQARAQATRSGGSQDCTDGGSALHMAQQLEATMKQCHSDGKFVYIADMSGKASTFFEY